MLKINDKIPNFEILTDLGKFKISNYTGNNMVIFFFPKADTSGCTAESIAFTNLQKIFDEEEILCWDANFVEKSLIQKRDAHFMKMFIVLNEEAKINTEIIINKVRCYKKNYMIHHPKMRILYVIDVVDLVIYLLNAMPKDTLRVILYINKPFKI